MSLRALRGELSEGVRKAGEGCTWDVHEED